MVTARRTPVSQKRSEYPDCKCLLPVQGSGSFIVPNPVSDRSDEVLAHAVRALLRAVRPDRQHGPRGSLVRTRVCDTSDSHGLKGFADAVARCLDLIRPLLRQLATPAAVRAAVFEGYKPLATCLQATDLSLLAGNLIAMVEDLSEQSEQPEATRQAAADALLAFAELAGPQARGEGGQRRADESDSGGSWQRALGRALDKAYTKERAYSVRRTLLQGQSALEGRLEENSKR